ncbi:MAG: hypothetical protein DRO13_02620 [Thermoprotei archaeon]|nr:MAG: hypothetical protein DRO13_02620 [Thermoprotei archaeon]
MKGVIPIVMAMTIVFMLVIATIYYTTMIVTYRAEIALEPVSAAEWSNLGEEIYSILLTSIRESSPYALERFLETFTSYYGDDGFQEEPDRVILREVREKGSKEVNNYTYYRYSYFSSTVLNDLDSLNLEGFSTSLADYLDALGKASADASRELRARVSQSITRWKRYREELGYQVTIANLTAYFVVDLETDPVNGSTGYGRIVVSAVVDVYSPWSGYRSFNETVEIIFRVMFKEAVDGGEEVVFPLVIEAYVRMGESTTSYILDPSTITVTLYSNTFHRMSNAKYTPGQPDRAVLTPVGGYYYGNGTNLLYYALEMARDRYLFVRDSIVYNMSLSDPDFDLEKGICWAKEFRVPHDEEDTKTKLPRHTMTIFWGGLVTANIDGIYVAAPLSVVYGYRYMTDASGYCWVYEDRIVGDVGMIQWS